MIFNSTHLNSNGIEFNGICLNSNTILIAMDLMLQGHYNNI